MFICKSSFGTNMMFSSVTMDEFVIILLKNTCYESHEDCCKNVYDAGNKWWKTPVFFISYFSGILDKYHTVRCVQYSLHSINNYV